MLQPCPSRAEIAAPKGHQVAVELRSYEKARVLALDVSAKAGVATFQSDGTDLHSDFQRCRVQPPTSIVILSMF